MSRVVPILLAFLTLTSISSAEEPLSPIGAATVDITPGYPVRLVGYGNRTKESEGVETPIKARALAVGGDAEGAAVLIAVDSIGVPRAVRDEAARRLQAKAGLRPEALAVSATHTHCGPGVGGTLDNLFGGPIPPPHQAHIDQYTRELTDALVTVGLAALADRKPGRLSWSTGSAGFAVNRRLLKDGKWVNFGVNPDGPVDRSVPVLKVTGPNGEVRAVVAGYACHCTTLGPDFNKISGDWAGYACDGVEAAFPGAVAMVVIGCGADANPEPRRNLADAKAHGSALAREVVRLVRGPSTPLPGRVAAAYRLIDIPFGPLPTRAALTETLKKPGAEGYHARSLLAILGRGDPLPTTHPYPVQTWTFGDGLAMVFLGGEVVVDYATRLRREGDPARLWVVAYANDVPCYIASERVIAEGGYEVDYSMTYYGRPSRLSPAVESLIVKTVHDLLPDPLETPPRRP